MPAKKRPRKSIKLDRVSPDDFLNKNLIYCCEQCSHFCSENQTCTIGYVAKQHLREKQLEKMHLHSHMAFCRFIEID